PAHDPGWGWASGGREECPPQPSFWHRSGARGSGSAPSGNTRDWSPRGGVTSSSVVGRPDPDGSRRPVMPTSSIVDLITAYSKRPDLADALVRAVQQIERAQDRGNFADRSVRSTARSGQPRRVVDRLSAAEIRLLIDAFERGTPKWKLAEQYAISESSIKRLLRKHRAEQDSVVPGA
ncbi:MAG TPA: hypothetical protein VJ846_04435, partial [Sphingomicrobium sp.]|nr:hypothetical protein [Sphingomicrobium sp.]